MAGAPAVQVWPQPGLKDTASVPLPGHGGSKHLQQGEDPTPHRHNRVLLQ